MDASVKVTKEWVNDADKADVTRPQLTSACTARLAEST